MSATWHWLLWEAAIPLFGATALFLAFGIGKWITAEKGKTFKWAWKESLDSMGWLYGGAFLALQAGMKGSSSALYSELVTLVWASYSAAAACLIVLACGMVNRGENPTWKPPRSMLVATCAMMFVIVGAGFKIEYAANAVAASGVANVEHGISKATDGT